MRIESFTGLTVWQKGHQLVLSVYEITNLFPKEERYSLTDQIRRCGVSITSNIAEGFSRKGKREKIQFYYLAKGSLTELQNQLLVARDVGYLSKEDFGKLSEQTIDVHRLLNRFISATKAKF